MLKIQPSSVLRIGGGQGGLQIGGAVSYSISGIVYDADGATPVSGATVALGLLTAMSAADGAFAITDIPPDTSGSLTCTKAGYSWTEISIAAMSESLTAQNFVNAWWAAGGIGASCLAAYQAIGAASLAASYINLANPGTYDLTAGSAPAFGANGWTFATNKYLKTGVLPTTGGSMFVQFSDANAGARIVQYIAGAYGGAGKFFAIAPIYQTNDILFGNGSFIQVAGGAKTSGNVGIAGNRGYYNGSTLGGAITAGTDPGVEIYIGTLNGAQTNYIDAVIQAVAIYSAAIAPAPLSTAMAALPL